MALRRPSGSIWCFTVIVRPLHLPGRALRSATWSPSGPAARPGATEDLDQLGAAPSSRQAAARAAAAWSGEAKRLFVRRGRRRSEASASPAPARKTAGPLAGEEPGFRAYDAPRGPAAPIGSEMLIASSQAVVHGLARSPAPPPPPASASEPAARRAAEPRPAPPPGGCFGRVRLPSGPPRLVRRTRSWAGTGVQPARGEARSSPRPRVGENGRFALPRSARRALKGTRRRQDSEPRSLGVLHRGTPSQHDGQAPAGAHVRAVGGAVRMVKGRLKRSGSEADAMAAPNPSWLHPHRGARRPPQTSGSPRSRRPRSRRRCRRRA